MKYSVSFLLFATFLLIGAGCASTEPITDDATPDNAPVVSLDPVVFSTLTKNILESKDDYKEFRFQEGTGTCITQGFSESFSYLEDAGLGYFIVNTADESYKDAWVSATAANYIYIDKVPLTGGEAECYVHAPKGSDTITLNCGPEETPICDATFTGIAIPR